MSESALLLHKNSSKESRKFSTKKYKRTRLLPAFLFTSFVVLLLLVQNTSGVCVWEGNGGFKLACGFRQSGLFRIRSIGGLKGWAGAGFTIGDEDGFKDSLTNADVRKQHLTRQQQQRLQQQQQQQLHHQQQQQQLLLQQQKQQQQQGLFNFGNQPSQFKIFGLGSNVHEQQQSPPEVTTVDQQIMPPQTAVQQSEVNRNGLQKRSSYWKWPLNLFPRGRGPHSSHHKQGLPMPMPMPGPSPMPMLQRPLQSPRKPPRAKSPLQMFAPKQKHPSRNPHFRPQQHQQQQYHQQQPGQHPYAMNTVPVGVNLQNPLLPQSQQPHRQGIPYFPMPNANEPVTIPGLNDPRPYGLKLLEGSQNYGTKFLVGQIPGGPQDEPPNSGVEEVEEIQDVTAGYDTNVFPDIYFTTTTPKDKLTPLQKQLLESELQKLDHPSTKNKIKLKKVRVIKHRGKQESKKGRKKVTPANSQEPSEESASSSQETTTKKPKKSKITTTEATTAPSIPSTSTIKSTKHGPDYGQNMYYRPQDSSSIFNPQQQNQSPDDERIRAIKILQSLGFSPPPSTTTSTTTPTPPLRNPLSPLLTSGYDPRYPPDHPVNREILRSLTTTTTTTPRTFFSHNNFYDPHNHFTKKLGGAGSNSSHFPNPQLGRDHQSYVTLDSHEATSRINLTKSYNDQFYNHYNKTSITTFGVKPKVSDIYWIHAATTENGKDFPIKPVKSNTWTHVGSSGENSRFTTTVSSVMGIDQSSTVPSETLEPYRPKLEDLTNSNSESTESSRFPQWNSIHSWQGFKKNDRFGSPVDFVTNDNFKSNPNSELDNTENQPAPSTTESTTTESTTTESTVESETESPATRRPSRRRYRTSTTPAPTTEGQPEADRGVKRHKHHRKRYRIRTFATTTATTPTPLTIETTTTTTTTERPQKIVTSMDASYSWSGGDGFKHDINDQAPIRSTSENSITRPDENDNSEQTSEDGFIPPISREIQQGSRTPEEDRFDTFGNSITQETPGEEADYNRKEKEQYQAFQPPQSQPPREDQFHNFSPPPPSRPQQAEAEEEEDEESDQREEGNGFMPTTGSSITNLLHQVDSMRQESSYPNFGHSAPESIVPKPANAHIVEEQLLLVPEGETMDEEKEEEETSYDEPQEEENSQQPRPFPQETRPSYPDEIAPSTYRPTYHRNRPQQGQAAEEESEEEDEVIPPILPENRQKIKKKPVFLKPQSEMMAPPPGTNYDQTYSYNHENNFQQQNQQTPPHLQQQHQNQQNHHHQQQQQQQQTYHFTTLGHAENSPLPKQNLAPPPLPAVDEYIVRQQADPLNETSSSLPNQNFFPPPPSHYQIYGAYQDPNQILKENKPKPAFRFPSIPLATLNPFAAFQKPQKVKQDQSFYPQGSHPFASTLRPGPSQDHHMMHPGQRPQGPQFQGPPHQGHQQHPHMHQQQPQHFNPHQYQHQQQQPNLNQQQPPHMNQQQPHFHQHQHQQQFNQQQQHNWGPPQVQNQQSPQPQPFKPSPPAPMPKMTEKPLTEKESVLKALETLSKVKTDVIQSIVHEKLGGPKNQSPTPQSPPSKPFSTSSPVLPSRTPQRNQASVSLSTDAISSLFSSKADHDGDDEGESPSIQDQIKELMKLKQAKEILMKQKLQEQQDHQAYMKALQKQQQQLQQQQKQQASLVKPPQAAQSPDLQTKLKLAAILQQPNRNYSATQLETIKKILALNHIEESLKTAPRPNPSHAPPAGRDALNVITPPSPNTLSAIQLDVLKHRLSQSANRAQQIQSHVLQHKSDEFDQAPNQVSSAYPTGPSGNSNVQNLQNALASVPTILALKALALKKSQGIRPTPQVVLPQQVKPHEDNAQNTQAIDLSAILASPSPIQVNFPQETYPKWSSRAPLTDVKNAPKSFYPGESVLKFDTNSTLYTDFQCDDQKHFPGLYADPALSCKVFHLCAKTDKGYMRKSFRCPEETVFDQEVLRCNWNLYVECSAAESKYHFNKYLSESFQFLRVLGEFSSSYKARNPSESKT